SLVESPTLANLRALNLTGNAVGIGGLKAVAGSPHLRGLVTLDLDYRPDSTPSVVTVEHGRSFLAALNMPDLRPLRLAKLPLGPQGGAILAHPRFAHLTRLKLTYCALGDAGAAALISSPHFQ